MNEHNYNQQFVLVFRTNINNKRHVKSISPHLDASSDIIKWNVDLGDIDNVLRIEATCPDCGPLIELVKQAGYSCEELID